MNVCPNGNYIAGCADGTIYLYSNTGFLVKMLRWHSMAVLGVKVFGDGRMVSTSKDCKAVIWSPEGECINLIDYHTDVPLGLAICSTGCLATCDLSGVMFLWEDPSREKDPTQKTQGHEKKISCVAVRGSNQFITASLDMTLKVWDIPPTD